MDKIFNLGITENQSTYLKGKIILTNQMAVILFCVGLTYGVLTISFPPITLLAAIGLVLCVLVLLLNYCKFYNASRVLIALMPTTVLSLIHANIVQPNDPLITSLSIGYIAISVIPFLIFDMREIKLTLSTIIIIWSIFMFQDHTNKWIQTPIDSSLFYEPFMVFATNLINVCIITFTLIFFQLKNYKTEKENTNLISTLQHQKEKLAKQRDFIKTQNERIITANSKLEATVKQKEQQLKYLIESSEDMITLHDEQGTYLYFNGPQNSNIQAEEIVGKTPYDLFDHESAKHISEAIKKVFSTGKSLTFENRLNWNGTKKWFSEYIYPVKDWEGNIKSVAKICQDIENRKIAEKKLKESEERLSVIYNSNDNQIGLIKVLKNGKFELESMNKTAIEALKEIGALKQGQKIEGLDVENFYKNILQYSESKIKNRIATFNKVASEKRVMEYEYMTNSPTAQQSFFKVKLSPILDQSGDCVQLLYVTENVTERFKNAQALKSSKDRLSLIYNNTQNFILLVRNESERGFMLESFNAPAWKEFRSRGSKLIEEEVIEKDITYFYQKAFNYSDQLIQERLELFREVIKSKQSFTYEGIVEFASENITSMHFENSITPIFDAEDKCTHLLIVVQNITERKQAQLLLEQSKEEIQNQLQLNQLILETTLDGYILSDTEANIVDVNPAYCKMLGYSKEEFLKMNILKDLESEITETEIERRVHQLQENGRISLETKHVGKEGTLVDISANLSLIQFNGVPMIAAFIRDVTEQKKARLLLEQSREEIDNQLQFNQRIIETTFDGYILGDKDANIIDVNDAYCQLIGYSREELLKMKITQLTKTETKEKAKQIIKNGGARYETRHTRKDGVTIDFDVNLSVIDFNGEPVVASFQRDITDQKKSQLLLERSREEINQQLQLNQLILNTTLDGYLLVDSNTDIIDVNPSYCELIGYSREELLKMNITDLEVKLSPKEVELHTEYLKENGSNRVESKHIRKDGTIIDVDTNLNLIQFEGKPMIAGFVRDITSHKQARKELEYRLNFESLLTKISAKFINLPLHDLDQGITNTLRQICKFIGFDRAYLVIFSEERNDGSIHYEWSKSGIGLIKSEYQNVPSGDFPWFINKLKNNELIIIKSLDDIPEAALALKKDLQNRKIQSQIHVPLTMQEKVIGFIGYDALTPIEEWPKELEVLLRFSGDMIINVLQRIKGEIALKDSEEQLAMIYNNSSEYVGLIRVEKGNCFYLESLNKTTIGAIKMAWPKLDINQLKGIELFKFLKKIALFNDQHIKKTKKEFLQLVKSKKEIKSQGIIPISFEGKPFFAYDASVIPIANAEGDCNYILFVTQDVTETKIAENAIKASEQQLSQIYNNNMDYIGLIELGPNNTFVVESVNQSVIEFLNKATDGKIKLDLVGMDIGTLLERYLNFSKEEIEERITIIKQVIDKKERFIHQHQMVSPIDGEMIIFESVFSPILEDGKCGKVLCVIKDVTEKQKSKEALIMSEKRMSSIFNGSKDLMTIFSVQKDESILLEQVNQTFIDLWKKAGNDLTPEELFGKDINYYNHQILGLTKKKTIERYNLLKRIIKSKKVYNFEEEYYTVNDIKYYFDVTITPIINDKEKCEKILFVARDISFKKKANERLILKILETEDRERKRISKELHDGLGQNLTTASLNLNYLKNAVSQIDDGYKIKFQNGIKFLNNAIDESRNIAHNLMPQSIIDFGYVMTIESLIDDLNETTNTQFVFYNNVNEERLISYHELSLFRITQEAINNVLKHAKASKVTLQLMKYPDALLLTIEDNGQGFEMEKTKGHSFGLNSIKARVSALSGSIHIDSSIGNGTSITIEIPI